jgi:hypothetical protein
MERPPNPHLESFKNFLDLQSAAATPRRQCDGCGAAMEYFAFQFWFSESEQEWNIPVPFCPFCEPGFAIGSVEVGPH